MRLKFRPSNNGSARPTFTIPDILDCWLNRHDPGFAARRQLFSVGIRDAEGVDRHQVKHHQYLLRVLKNRFEIPADQLGSVTYQPRGLRGRS